MRKELSHICLLFLTLLMFVGCGENDVTLPDTPDYQLTLTLSLPGSELKTRATEDGKDAFNENVIRRVDLFLYPSGKSNENAVVVLPAVSHEYNSTTHQSTIAVSIGLSKFKQLFPNYDSDVAQTCEAYALVNRPAGTELPAATDMASLNEIALSQPIFSVVNEDGDVRTNSYPSEFVMSGTATDVALSGDKKSLSGDIPVYRTAAKVTLELTHVEDRVYADDGVNYYEPDLTSIRVGFVNGQTKGFVNSATLPPNDGFFDNRNIMMKAMASLVGHFTVDVPFYTYPTDWRTDMEHRSNLLLTIRWRKNGTGTYDFTYYEIPINDGEEQLKRNTHYKINMEVGVIGGWTPESAVKVEQCSYIILPWGSSDVVAGQQLEDVNADMKLVRYLAVGENEAEMDNIISKLIYYSTSHEVEIVNLKLEKMNLENQSAGWETKFQSATYDVANRPFNVVLYPGETEEDASYFNVEHELDNRMLSVSDYSDYRISFRIRHKDNTDFYEDIVLIQHPMIYVQAEQNSDFSDDNNSNNDNAHYGYRYTNGVRGAYSSAARVYSYTANEYYNNRRSRLSWEDAAGTSNASNKNPNRYIITATSLTTDDYTIGDSRVSSYEDYTMMGSYTSGGRTYYYCDYGANLYGSGTKRLQYYYRTEESDRTVSMIAPQFMIASSYGASQSLTKANARARCASYQEDGYPAGRWRLPTQAEIRYIVQLSTWDIIPILFANQDKSVTTWSDYWTANGAVSVCNYSGLSVDGHVQENNSATSAYVRCVYDYWYWGDDKCALSTFTWGDKVR